MGPFIYQSRKNGSIIYSFLGKRGLIVYLAVLKKGAIRAAHPYHVIYRELPPEYWLHQYYLQILVKSDYKNQLFSAGTVYSLHNIYMYLEHLRVQQLLS